MPQEEFHDNYRTSDIIQDSGAVITLFECLGPLGNHPMAAFYVLQFIIREEMAENARGRIGYVFTLGTADEERRTVKPVI